MPSLPSTEQGALPDVFILELTYQCNHQCLYCYGVWNARRGQRQHCNGQMSTAAVKAVIAKLQDETPVASIGLSGGEPTLREDFAEILSFIMDRGIMPVVITNGSMLSGARAPAIIPGCNYEVTLLSHRQEVHNHLAGRRGAWEAAIDGMINVRKAGGNLTAVFVATKLNSGDLPRTTELAMAIGANGMMYNRINLGMHNLCSADQLLPTPTMIRENLDALEEIGTKYDFPVVAATVIEPCVVDGRGYKHIHFGWCPLAGENSYFTIDPVGNIRICNHSPVVLGNIWKDSFSDIYFNHPYLRNFRETWPVECMNCDPELRAFCRGGCKAAAEQCYGTLTRVDPFVTLCRDLTVTCRHQPDA